MSADVAAGCFLAYCFSYTLTPLAIFRVLMLDLIYRPLSAFGNVCLHAIASLFRGKASARKRLLLFFLVRQCNLKTGLGFRVWGVGGKIEP